MSAESPVTEAEWDQWQQVNGGPRYTRKEPLKRDLLAAKAKWDELLGRCLNDGESVVINGDDGQPAAVLVPYAKWKPHLGVGAE